MFNSRKSNKNWVMMSSAMLGGFLLGFSYRKYGKDIVHRFQKMTKENMVYGDYMNSHDPNA